MGGTAVAGGVVAPEVGMGGAGLFGLCEGLREIGGSLDMSSSRFQSNSRLLIGVLGSENVVEGRKTMIQGG